MRKIEDLSRRAQKFYRNNPEAYIELQEIQQRGSRICSECQTEIALKQTECPGCGRQLRKPRYTVFSKWILGAFLILSISSAITAIIVLGKVPCCDASVSLALLRKQFDHSLYATSFGLISSSASAYGPEQGLLLFRDRLCRGIIETENGSGFQLEFTLEHRTGSSPGLKYSIISDP